MDYLLDTNVVSDLIRENPRVNSRLRALPPDDRVFTCTVVRGEVLYGLARLPAGKRRALLEERVAAVFDGLPCEAIPASAADIYAGAKLSRQRGGLPLDDNDCWIAATALALGAKLVSRDADMRQIDGLTVEDWSA